MAVHPPFPPGEGRIVSGYGYRRGRTTGERTFHAGIDLWAPRGTPILAIEDGVVRITSEESVRHGHFNGYGNAAIVRHDDGSWVMYAHMDSLTVTQGERVHAGRQLGTVGNTSNGKFRGMGPHLHAEWRMERGDRAPYPGPYGPYNSFDPVPWLRERGIVFGEGGRIEVREGSEAGETLASYGRFELGPVEFAGTLGGVSGPLGSLGSGLPDEPWPWDRLPLGAVLSRNNLLFGGIGLAAGIGLVWFSSR